MKNKINHIACTLVLLSIMLISCTSKEKKALEEETGAKIDSAEVFILEKQEVSKTFSFPSELIALERAEMFAKVSGYIKLIKADIGDRVIKGQILAVIEAPEMSSNLSQANADVRLAHSRYLSSLDAFKRIENAAKVSGTVAMGELEKSRNQMLADKAAEEAAKSKMNTMSSLKDYLTIRSPFAGVVVQRNADTGTLVGAANALPIFIIENTSSLRLRVPVQEAFSTAVSDSSSVSFTVDAQPDKKYYAKLSRKAGAINKGNRTEIWEFIFDNKNQELKSGMYANAVLKLERTGSSFVAAPSAICTTLEKKFVIRLSNKMTQSVNVRNGINTGDKLEIFGDLKPGDTLLLNATDEIEDGTVFIPKFKKSDPEIK